VAAAGESRRPARQVRAACFRGGVINLETAMGRTTDYTDDTDSESSGWCSLP
jgi:hypothetical protein